VLDYVKQLRALMAIVTKNIQIKSRGEDDVIDITKPTLKAIKESNLKNGIVTIFISGSTAAITTIEYEPGLRNDFPKMLNRIIPRDIEYEHDKTWNDGNGHSHVRASLVGPSLTIPFKDGTLMLGIWQQVVLLEMDTRQRERQLVLQIIGE